MNALAVAAIVGLCQVAKTAGFPTRFVPVLAVVLGVASILVLKDGSLLDGVLAGLSAVGLYSSSRAVVGE